MEKILRGISIRGRMAFCIACIYEAINKEGVKVADFEIVLNVLKEFLDTNEFDIWETKAVEISPDTISDTHPDNNFEDYHTLSKEQVENLERMYSSIPQSIVQIISLTISVGIANLYGATGQFSYHSLTPVMELIGIMEDAGYDLPNIESYVGYSFSENHGWGSVIKE